MVKIMMMPIVRSSFRLNQDQKMFLFKVFEAWEKTDNKSSPEEVHKLMRNSFTPKDYCTTQSSFSSWVKEVRTSSLLELHDYIVSSGMFLTVSFSLYVHLYMTKYTKISF